MVHILVDGVARYCLENPAEMIFIDKKCLRQAVQGKIPGQVFIDVQQNVFYPLILNRGESCV